MFILTNLWLHSHMTPVKGLIDQRHDDGRNIVYSKWRLSGGEAGKPIGRPASSSNSADILSNPTVLKYRNGAGIPKGLIRSRYKAVANTSAYDASAIRQVW